MVSLGALVLGWFLGAIPLLFVLRATAKRHTHTLDAMFARHDALVAEDRAIFAAQLDAAIKDAIAAERNRATEAAIARREREPKMVVVRPY